MSANCCVWDFTLKSDGNDKNDIINILNTHCKKWAFQKEMGKKTGFLHFQGRLNLKQKKRKHLLIKLFNNNDFSFSVTSNANKNNNFYVLKKDTRISGPWTNEDPKKVMTRQLKNMKKLKPFQKSIIEMSKKPNDRIIDVIVQKKGNKGKTLLAEYMEYYNHGALVPFCNDYKDILRIVYGMADTNAYIIDMPRCSKKDKLFQMFSAIETIKGGYTYDDRYTFKKRWFSRPRIFIFTNDRPDNSLLSRDMWKLWTINDNDELVDYDDYNFIDNEKETNHNKKINKSKSILDHYNNNFDNMDESFSNSENNDIDQGIPKINNIISHNLKINKKKIKIDKIKKITPTKKNKKKTYIKKQNVKSKKKISIKKQNKLNYKIEIKKIQNNIKKKYGNNAYIKICKNTIDQIKNEGKKTTNNEIYLKLLKIQNDNYYKKYKSDNINIINNNNIYNNFNENCFVDSD